MRDTWHSSQLSWFIKGHSLLQKSLPRLSEFCTSAHNYCLAHTVGRQPSDLLQSHELVRQLTAEWVDDHPNLQGNFLWRVVREEDEYVRGKGKDGRKKNLHYRDEKKRGEKRKKQNPRTFAYSKFRKLMVCFTPTPNVFHHMYFLKTFTFYFLLFSHLYFCLRAQHLPKPEQNTHIINQELTTSAIQFYKTRNSTTNMAFKISFQDKISHYTNSSRITVVQKIIITTSLKNKNRKQTPKTERTNKHIFPPVLNYSSLTTKTVNRSQTMFAVISK